MRNVSTHIKAILLLGLPIIVGQLGIVIQGMADTIMVGQYPALNPLEQAKLISDDLEDFARTVAAVVETHRARMNMLLGARYGLQEEK